MIKQIRLPLRGRPILLITRMITDRIGLHSVLLPLRILFHFLTVSNNNINYIDFLQPCVDLDEWVQPCSVNYMYHVQDVSCCDEDMEELQDMFFYQVKVN